MICSFVTHNLFTVISSADVFIVEWQIEIVPIWTDSSSDMLVYPVEWFFN